MSVFGNSNCFVSGYSPFLTNPADSYILPWGLIGFSASNYTPASGGYGNIADDSFSYITLSNIVILSGDLTVSSLMLNYTGSSGNLDFLINSLLWLNYEDDMLLVRNKLPANTALYKADEKKLAASQLSVMTISAIVPIIYMTLIGSAVYILRKKEQYAADTQ